MRLLVIAVLANLATACAPTVLTIAPTPVDMEMASALLGHGTSTVKGSALLRQRGGGVVTCAENPVYLVPATPSVTQQIRQIFGGESGYVAHGGDTVIGGGTVVAPIEPNRMTTCNAQGFFSFANVRAGRWHVMTTVLWTIGDSHQGGALLRTAEVADGAEVEVVLTG